MVQRSLHSKWYTIKKDNWIRSSTLFADHDTKIFYKKLCVIYWMIWYLASTMVLLDRRTLMRHVNWILGAYSRSFLLDFARDLDSSWPIIYTQIMAVQRKISPSPFSFLFSVVAECKFLGEKKKVNWIFPPNFYLNLET